MNLPNLGIDIAKAKFNVCLLLSSGKLKHKVFPNTEAGFTLLSAWLLQLGVERVHACLEATGTYGEALRSPSDSQCGQSGSHQSLCCQSTFTHQN